MNCPCGQQREKQIDSLVLSIMVKEFKARHRKPRSSILLVVFGGGISGHHSETLFSTVT
jgi:hypothetical protein